MFTLLTIIIHARVVCVVVLRIIQVKLHKLYAFSVVIGGFSACMVKVQKADGSCNGDSLA
jgi:hypothetical protein